jgi:hypothetical protein
MPLERAKRYRCRFDVSDQQIECFVNRYYDAICESDITLFASVVDKIQTQEDYPNPWYPPALAYEFLLQRIVQEVPAGKVKVTVDDMSGATPKGSQYRDNLNAHHEQLCKKGSRLVKKLDFSPLLPGIRFVDSAQSHLIQVADVVAYNVYRQFVDHGASWECGTVGPDGEPSLPTYGHFELIVKKFRRGRNGRIQGFGIVKFPKRESKPWSWDE